jgi:hypothetical protein
VPYQLIADAYTCARRRNRTARRSWQADRTCRIEVEEELAYPGQIRVAVVRESRTSEFAR